MFHVDGGQAVDPMVPQGQGEAGVNNVAEPGFGGRGWCRRSALGPFLDGVRFGADLCGVGQVTPASPEDRHRPRLPAFRHLGACLDIGLHATADEFGKRPVPLARDALQVPEERLGKLDLGTRHDGIIMPT
jgi:hypothetical protein